MMTTRANLRRFKPGDVLAAASLEAVRRVSSSLLDTNGDYRGPLTKTAVVLNDELAKTTNALKPTSAMAQVCVWDEDAGEYVQTADEVKVWNHSEDSDFEEDTFGFMETIDGHDVFFGDCEPMDDRPAPPGGA